MINNSALRKSLNHESTIFYSSIVFNGDLYNSILNEVHFISKLILFTHDRALLKSLLIHIENDLLLRGGIQLPKIVDLLHFKLQKVKQLI
jgi:hypothetical protein